MLRDETESLSGDAELLSEARVRSQGRSLSTDVNDGLRQQILPDRRRALLADWEAKFAPISEDALVEMAGLWPD